MHCVAVGIENGSQIVADILRQAKDVGGGKNHVFGKTTGTVHTDAFGVPAKVAAAGPAIAAVMAGQVSFAGNPLTGLKTVHFAAGAFDDAGELMTGDERDRYGLPGPFVPLVDMQVGATNGCFFLCG